jgi:hypothetical protein
MVTFVKEFEQYVLSENKEESLLSIIPGSQADTYMQFISQIKSIEEKGKIPEEVIKKY